MRSVGAPRALRHADHRSVLQTGILQRSGPNGTFARLLRFLARRCRMWCRHVRDCATHGGALWLRALVGPSVRRRPDERGTIECATDARVPMRMAEKSVFNAMRIFFICNLG